MYQISDRLPGTQFENAGLVRERTYPPPESEESGIVHDKTMVVAVAYMFSTGVCGMILVLLCSTLHYFAENCETTELQVSTLFIARGLGAIFGSFFSAKLYAWFHGNNVMVSVLLLMVVILVCLPFSNSIMMLHIVYHLLGIGTSVIEAGSQLLTKRFHGKLAEPWLGANTVAFGVGGALVPFISVFTGDVYSQCYVVAFTVVGAAAVVHFGPGLAGRNSGGIIGRSPSRGRMSTSSVDSNGNGNGSGEGPHYYVEVVVGLMVFLFTGGMVTITAYLHTYVEETGIMSVRQGAALLLVLWIGIAIGRFVGVQDARYLTSKTLPIHLTIFCVSGATAMFLVLWFPQSPSALWIGVALYGLSNGPCVGCSYDVNCRITYPTERSLSVIMVGLHLGASLVPFLAVAAWNQVSGGPSALVYVVLFSMLLPVPLQHATKCLSYDPAANPHIRNSYMAVPTEEDMSAI